MSKLIVLAALLALFALVGTMDYADAEADQAQYCEMVKARIWPDYKGIYRKVCQPTKPSTSNGPHSPAGAGIAPR